MKQDNEKHNLILPRCGVGMTFTNKLQIYEKMKSNGGIHFDLSNPPRNTTIFNSSVQNNL